MQCNNTGKFLITHAQHPYLLQEPTQVLLDTKDLLHTTVILYSVEINSHYQTLYSDEINSDVIFSTCSEPRQDLLDTVIQCTQNYNSGTRRYLCIQ